MATFIPVPSFLVGGWFIDDPNILFNVDSAVKLSVFGQTRLKRGVIYFTNPVDGSNPWKVRVLCDNDAGASGNNAQWMPYAFTGFVPTSAVGGSINEQFNLDNYVGAMRLETGATFDRFVLFESYNGGSSSGVFNDTIKGRPWYIEFELTSTQFIARIYSNPDFTTGLLAVVSVTLSDVVNQLASFATGRFCAISDFYNNLTPIAAGFVQDFQTENLVFPAGVSPIPPHTFARVR